MTVAQTLVVEPNYSRVSRIYQALDFLRITKLNKRWFGLVGVEDWTITGLTLPSTLGIYRHKSQHFSRSFRFEQEEFGTEAKDLNHRGSISRNESNRDLNDRAEHLGKLELWPRSAPLTPPGTNEENLRWIHMRRV